MKKTAALSLLLLSLSLGCEDPVCGNGAVESGEQCDDGNIVAGDACNAQCVVESGYECPMGTNCAPVCGDHLLVDQEVCDPSVPGYSQYCSADCTKVTGSCGDGIVQSPVESCDNTLGGCTTDCRVSFGYTCASNVCNASDVDPAKTLGSLTAAEKTTLCTWFIGALGGAGSQHTCGSIIYTTASISMCTSNIVNAGSGCAVSQMEAWVAAKGSACGVFQSPDPAVCN